MTEEPRNYSPHNRDYYHMPFEDLSTHGILWLINRTVFHPRGLAMTITLNDDGKATGWGLIGDSTQPFTFTATEDDEHFLRVQEFLKDYLAGVQPEGEW